MPSLATYRLLALAVAAEVAASACAGLGSGARFTPASGLSAPQSRLVERTAKRISGLVKATNWTVPKGQTVVVRGNAAVVATGNIDIDGTLDIDPGVSLALYAKHDLTISGKVEQSADRARTAPVSEENGFYLVAAHVVLTKEGSQNKAVRDLIVVSSQNEGIVTFDGASGSGPGANGTNGSAAPNTPGGAQDGGTVEIGTPIAQKETELYLRTLDRAMKFASFKPELVSIDGTLAGGYGGYGYFDRNGVADGATQVLHGGDGGNGGDVTIDADSTIVTGKVYAGDGGLGGAAGYDEYAAEFNVPMDGTAPLQAGRNLVATLGNGGNGGTLTITGKVKFSKPPPGSRGGEAGALYYARAGNGGPAGNGGTTTVYPGVGGTGTIAYGQALPSKVTLMGGGAGGASASEANPGGTGGNVMFIPKTGAGTVTLQVYSEIGSAYANGGAGFNGCTSADGTNGGGAGNLNVPASVIRISNSFNGGNGGTGVTTAGLGGAAGTDSTGKAIGSIGSSGTLCPPSGAFAVAPTYKGFDAYVYTLGSAGALTAGTHLTPEPTISSAQSAFQIPGQSCVGILNGGGSLSTMCTSNGGSSFSAVSSDVATHLLNPTAVVSNGSYCYMGDQSSATVGFCTISPTGTLTMGSPTTVPDNDYPSVVVADFKFGFLYAGAYYLAQFGIGPGGALGAGSDFDTYPGQISAAYLAAPDTYPTVSYRRKHTTSNDYMYVAWTGYNAGTYTPSISQYSVNASGATSLSPASFAVTSGTTQESVVDIKCNYTLCFAALNAGGGTGNAIYQYSIGGSGMLSALSTATIPLGAQPMSLSVDPSFKYLYVVLTNGQVQGFSIGSTGLTQIFAPTALANAPTNFAFVSAGSPTARRR